VLREIHLPLVEPFRTATGTADSRRIILVEMEDTDGVSVWSECVAGAVPSYTAETVDGAWIALADLLIPLVLGKSFSHPADVHSALWSWLPDQPMARASIEMAIWGLAALRRDEPLARFLGRISERGAPPRKSVATGIAIGMENGADALLEKIRLAVSEGYRRIKLKVSPDSDVSILSAARTEVGTDAALSVDANSSFNLENRTDMARLEEIDSLGLSMIEQPLGANAFEQHAELQRRIRTPICLDESIMNDSDAELMIRVRSARIVNMKPGRVGGLTEAVAIHDRCRLAEIPLWCGGMLESGIGRAYNVALASLPNFTLPGDISPSARYWERDVIEIPWEMDADGMVHVPLERPGIGVDADRHFIDGLVERESKFSAA
jgi:O-succinylbenzoate synthase